uniref:Uncharacterized protein n=1 Tax=Cryptomonas curvata TaxID=233186 RepID=A0A7S0M3G8_9CRYP|mmetsp:Transcript_19437/g.40853  ORF Transcript_19437/g.40853 Transcript_19437/m.40853 type:complete len:180 (+) Transcript_19437:1-540(+)|eukprot:CAMPEP_0172159680 /NCGR_PEP_ID=MMETSP1050-20130122/5109_1 /TAXON_ID=233186 /ORGANISM="Cryptomonas curvata, Strain CCAP979/52" /LENGTH=179 /DNA_ID=CAMNT_0012829303 /DNA_START=1 /DNA_END=540 /DNA_ORIENTATION=-
MEDAALKTAVAAAVKAALVPVNAELARVSEQLALVVSDNAELKERVEMLEEDICVFAPDKIRNVSEQVLLFFCGDQPVPEERLEQRKKHFQEMDEDKFFDFHTALEGEKDYTMRKLTANQWQVKFDNILDGRNGTIHFRDWDSLRAAVVEIRGMLLRHPKIGDNLKDEVKSLNSLGRMH